MTDQQSSPTILMDDFVAGLLHPDKEGGLLAGDMVATQSNRTFKAQCRRTFTTINKARRFVLADDVVRVVARASLSPPRSLMACLSRSRLPYDTVWFEWDEYVRVEALSGAPPNRKNVAGRLGLLCQRSVDDDGAHLNEMMVVVGRFSPEARLPVGTHPYGVGVSWSPDDPVAESWHPYMTAENADKTMIANMLWGREWADAWDGPDTPPRAGRYMRRLAQHVFPSFVGPMGHQMHDEVMPGPDASGEEEREWAEQLYDMLLSISGDVRFLVTLLAMLNTVQLATDREHAPAGSRYVGGRIRPYMSRHTVRLEVPKERAVRKVETLRVAGSRRRGHEVMGHYCVSRLDGVAGHDHAWVRAGDNLWVCHCGARKWWRKEHERGDASLGWVEKDYSVVASRRARQRRDVHVG